MGGKKKKVTIGYKYFMGLHMGICRGPIDALRQIRVGDKVAWTGKLSNNSSTFINQPKLFGGEEQEGGIEGTLDVMTGHKDQERNARLSAMLGGLTSAFRGVATVFFDGLVCAMSPYPKEWSFMVQKTKAGWHNDECWYPEKCEMLMAQRLLISGSDRVWRYAVFDRSDSGNYAAPAFNDSAWQTGVTPFASSPWSLPGQYGFATAPATVVPPSKKVWMRTKLSLAEKPKNARFQAFVDNDCTLYINGVVRASVGGNNGAYYDVALSDDAFFVGENVIAVEGSDRHAGPGNWFWFDWRIVDSSALEVWGMNPAHILRRLYTDPSIGRGLPASRLDEDSWRAAADKFYAEGFGLCMKWARTGSIADFAAEVINHAGAVVYTSRRTGKIVLKAIRDDYDINDLPLYTPDTGLLGFDDDEASAQTGGINEIVVNYKDPVEKADKAVREKNLGAIMAAGGVTISESVDYPGIPTEALARRVARRDLQAKSGFIKRFSVRLDRRGRDIMPGGVFRISDASRGIENMVLRAGRVEYGTITDGTVTVTALQDVFGLPATVYREPEENAYTPPDTSVKAPDLQAAMEAPYRDLVQAMSASDLAILAPDAGYLHAAAVRPTTLSQSFVLQTRVAPAEYTPAADMATFCPGGKLSAALDYLDTTAVLTDAQALDELQPGTAALIGGEIVRVDAVDVATSTLTIARGCADTVPAQHAAGTAVLCYDSWGGDDQTEYTAGVTVDAVLLTNTGAGQLPLEAAPVQTVTFAGRAARPYPPGDVKLNGERYPQKITGDLEITWAHRDRLLQADNLIDALQPSVGPEPGTTYAVELYDAASSTLLHSETGISTTTAVVPSTAFASDNRLELYSVRDEQQSWQRQVLRFRNSLEILGLLPGTANLESYHAQLSASLTGAAAWSIAAGALPLGLHLDPASGLISGVAQDTPGYYSVELRVVVDGLIARKTFTIGLGNYASLLHFDGSDNSSAFVDQTGKAWTRSGSSPVIKTDVAKVGSASLRLSGNNDYVQTANHNDFNLGSGDWTIRGWLFHRAFTQPYPAILSRRNGGAFDYGLQGNTELDSYIFRIGGPGWYVLRNAATNANTWRPFQVARKGNLVRTFSDGMLVAEQAFSGSITHSNVPTRIGDANFTDDGANCNLDEMSIIRGAGLDWNSGGYQRETPSDYPQPAPSLAISGSLPAGSASSAYSSSAIRVLSTGPLAVSVTSGTLPAGWSAVISGTAVTVSGTGASAGEYHFTLTVSDSASRTASLPLTLTVT